MLARVGCSASRRPRTSCESRRRGGEQEAVPRHESATRPGPMAADSAPALVNEYHATYRSHGHGARIG
jgi:hypothetical protein